MPSYFSAFEQLFWHFCYCNTCSTDADSSDPYVTVAFSRQGQPLYSTRIIQGDLNPVWEETAMLLLTDEEVKGEENLTAMLWDSDKRSADDLVGRVTIPVVELMKEVRSLIGP